MATLTGLGSDSLSDPQVVWDPGAQRFYYLILDVSRYGFGFGFSTTANPQSAADFCRYIVTFNNYYANSLSLTDYPKLAVTNDFVLVGSNVFNSFGMYSGSDVDWFQKPAATPGAASCPGSLGSGGIFSSLKNAGGSLTSTPVPAVNADPTSTGWVVGSADVGTGPASFLSVFKVTKDSSGNAVMSGATSIDVTSYKVPADAPQQGTTDVLDTLDTRLEHAVAAVDPRIGATATAIWTAHTVFGGAGAEDRWYEISTSGTPSLSQSGTVSSKAYFAWNGAISPDRADSGNAGSFGSNMVMGFNTSSATAYPAIQIVSQHGTSAQSGWIQVQKSLGPNVDFSCTGGSGNVCRWGDYSGAMPDPAATTNGQVWLSGEWNNPESNGSATVWQTWNWEATP